MAQIAVVKNEDQSFLGLATSKATAAIIRGDLAEDAVTLVTKKDFVPSDKYATWDDLIGKPKKEPKEKKESTGTRANATPLEGEYHLAKPLPACADDHPKKPIWVAIESNTNVDAAKAACPAENPKRKTNGVYTFASEFRYFLKTGYVAMGAAPEQGEEQSEEQAA